MRALNVFAAVCFSLYLGAAVSRAADEPAGPPPAAVTAEHKWLAQLVGKWETKGQLLVAPPGVPDDAPLPAMKGVESAKLLDNRWLIVSGELDCGLGEPMHTHFVLGFDDAKQKFVGTWVDSTTNHLWRYEGTLDAAGKKLTLDTEGPSMEGPGKTAKYQETIEVTADGQKVFTSAVVGADGKAEVFMKIEGQRAK